MNPLARFAARASLSFALFAAGCSAQTEGQRCDQTSDCETGLSCDSKVCCPAAGTSTVAACNPGFATSLPEASTPDASSPDASSPDVSTVDTGNDAQEEPLETDASTAE